MKRRFGMFSTILGAVLAIATLSVAPAAAEQVTVDSTLLEQLRDINSGAAG
jgi:hypothetical protein